MALRHVKDFYKKQEKQYLKMLSDAKEFDDLAKQGVVSPEQVENVHTMLSRLEENYKRLTYIMYLFALPNRDKKKDTNKIIKENLSKHSSEIMLQENEDVLKNFRDKLERLKNESGSNK